jgi:predicted PurR-regulated permease PerM
VTARATPPLRPSEALPTVRHHSGQTGERTLLAILAGCALLPILYFGAGYIVPVVAALVAALIMGPIQGRLITKGMPVLFIFFFFFFLFLLVFCIFFFLFFFFFCFFCLYFFFIFLFF